MFLGFTIINQEEIEKLKSDKILKRTIKKYALISVLFSLFSLSLQIAAIILSQNELTVSSFWLRFISLSFASIFWGLGISEMCIQFTINHNFYTILSLIISIICTISLFVAIFL